MLRAFWTLILWGIILSPVSLPAQDQSAEEKAKNLPEGKGKEIVGIVCQHCHALGAVTSLKLTLEVWRGLVQEMVSNGAPLQEEDVETVAQYLAKNFGPESVLAGSKEEKDGKQEKEPKEASSNPKINVNKSTAKGLEKDLGLSEEEAEAIVSYREKHGDFKSWEDLNKVAGLDRKKIEGVKDLLVF